MPFPRPTLTALRNQAMQDITSSDLPGADGLLRRAVLRVLAWVQAGMAHLHYGYLDWIGRQSVPFTAEDEFVEAWAALKNVVRKPSSATQGTASFPAVSGVIPSGTALQRSDQLAFVTTADAGAVSGTIVAPIQAVDPGTAGNFDDGTQFTLGVAITGITGTSSDSSQTVAGSDVETDDSLRARMLQAYQNPPQGGARADYVEWALAVNGVTRAWCAPMGLGAGTVQVFTMWDQAEAAFNGFPQGTNGTATGENRAAHATGDLLAVANYIYPLQPVTALVYSYKPTQQVLNFTVAGLTPLTTTTQAAATAALSDLLYRKASPLADTAIDQSDVDAAISAQPGILSFRVTAPAFPQVPAPGAIFTLGAITWA